MSYTITPELENYAHEVRQKYGVPESVTLGQAIYESSLGKSNIARQANNWFGMKGTGTVGSYNGWQKFNSVHESFLAYGKLLSKDRYTKYTNNAKTSAEYLQGVVKGGYCPDDGYVSNVLSIINSNNLEKYNTGTYTGNSDSDTENDSNILTNITGNITDSVKEIGAKVTTGLFILVLFIMSLLCITKIFSKG